MATVLKRHNWAQDLMKLKFVMSQRKGNSVRETQGEADTGVTQVCPWALEMAGEHSEGPGADARCPEGVKARLAPRGRRPGGPTPPPAR
uniref:Uncharacterized protein n=1 Tax=Rangifer tarandus platyrhynchus TaxID=3082113 RepID=A0ACB0DSG6_RANTA|nr:unnamed protein product [Rangifer tarandus platyrhynchus]